MFAPLLLGAAAVVLALTCAAVWVAIGTCLTDDESDPTLLSIVWALVVGCALSSTALAIASAAGFAWQGALVGGTAGAIVLIMRRARTAVLLRNAIKPIATAFRGDRFSQIALIALLTLLFVYAAAPPRDGDVVRYHLAHVRQIASENSWHWVPDVTYALPLAWSLNYLPFELLGLPQGAAMLNALVWVVLLALILEALSSRLPPAKALALSLCFLAHPFIIKTFSAAFADPFAILLTCGVALAITRLDRLTHREIALLGFASWVGIGSRYQMVAVGISATSVVAYSLARRSQLQRMRPFALGSASAAALASPFYLMNWKGIGNPVWPLFASSIPSANTYAIAVAEHFSARFTHVATAQNFQALVVRLFTERYLFPLPLILILVVVVASIARGGELRKVAAFGAGFLLLWIAMSPGLYPTHILPVLSLIPILAAPFFVGGSDRKSAWQLFIIRGIATVWVVLSAAFSYDYLRYDITGNAATYHRFTWYYPVYDWMNRHTEPSSRSLVVVYSGLSYYLDRPYRRADPWLSAEVDWSRVKNGADLDAIMSRGKFDYLVYDDLNWSVFPGGESMMRAIHDGVATRSLVPVFHSREKLYSGRVTRSFTERDVYVFKRAAAR